jgi:hypothetical protein
MRSPRNDPASAERRHRSKDIAVIGAAQSEILRQTADLTSFFTVVWTVSYNIVDVT